MPWRREIKKMTMYEADSILGEIREMIDNDDLNKKDLEYISAATEGMAEDYIPYDRSVEELGVDY